MGGDVSVRDRLVEGGRVVGADLVLADEGAEVEHRVDAAPLQLADQPREDVVGQELPALDPVAVERQPVAVDVGEVVLDGRLMMLGRIAGELDQAVEDRAHRPTRRDAMAAGDRGHLPDRLRRAARGDDVADLRPEGFRLPGVGSVGGEAPVGDLVVEEQEPVPRRGDERGLHVIGGGLAVREQEVRPEPRRGLGEAVGAAGAEVLLLEVVVELVAALVDGVVTAAEAVEGLVGGRREAVEHRRDAVWVRGPRRDPERLAAVWHHRDHQPPPARVGGRDDELGAAAAAGRCQDLVRPVDGAAHAHRAQIALPDVGRELADLAAADREPERRVQRRRGRPGGAELVACQRRTDDGRGPVAGQLREHGPVGGRLEPDPQRGSLDHRAGAALGRDDHPLIVDAGGATGRRRSRERDGDRSSERRPPRRHQPASQPRASKSSTVE